MSIIKIIIVLVFLYAVYKVVSVFREMKSQEARGYRPDKRPPMGEDLVQDPYCRTYVPKSQAYVKEIDGRQQYFCSRECCEKYLEEKK